ncbi:MAG TPA: hypothetical protein VHJ38_01270 [Nitrososphaeraceae archaeon]|jgi:hypothetical protein|nr:hypothetical protein [Nitrososphaeraceae archaeon]
MAYGIFREIERLLEYIPIEIDTYGIGKLASNTFIDSNYSFKDIDRIATRLGVLEVGRNTVSLRDIIKLLNKFLKDASIEELVENPRRYRESQKNSSGVPLKNLLFDFCLSALVSDTFNAKLFLTHSLYLTGLRRQLVILLSSIINDSNLVDKDNDVRELLTLLALLSEPNNIDIYFDINNDGFNIRYNTYLKEIKKLSRYNTNNNCNTTLEKINQVEKI